MGRKFIENHKYVGLTSYLTSLFPDFVVFKKIQPMIVCTRRSVLLALLVQTNGS